MSFGLLLQIFDFICLPAVDIKVYAYGAFQRILVITNALNWKHRRATGVGLSCAWHMRVYEHIQ